MGIIDKFFGIQELDDHETSNKDKLDTHLENAEKILNSENPETIQKYINAIIVKLNINNALNVLEEDSQAVDNIYNDLPGNIEKICKNLEKFDGISGKLYKYIYFDLNKEDIKEYERAHGSAVEFATDAPSFRINSIPLLVSPWNPSRVVGNISNINANNVLFPCLSDGNIQNTYIYPLGFSVATNGNHSQLSAILQNEGESSIERILDISKLYKFIEFDGESYKSKESNIDRKLQMFPPKMYSYDMGYGYKFSESEFYIGVLYEIGRLLLENYSSVYPDDIYKQYANCSWNSDPNAS